MTDNRGKSEGSSSESCTTGSSYESYGCGEVFGECCEDELHVCEDKTESETETEPEFGEYFYPRFSVHPQLYLCPGEDFVVGSDREHSSEISFERFGEYERTSPKPSRIESTGRNASIFVHSSPSQFPDIRKARKSVFGSIFLRATNPGPHESFLLQQMTESQFTMFRSMLDNHSETTEPHSMRFEMRDSLFKGYDSRGLHKDGSQSSESSQWDIYPITHSALFTFQVEDRIHQTRHLSRIEDRITNGPLQYLRFVYSWPSGSEWKGHWDGLGMAGPGVYMMPHEVCYIGKMEDGTCHDSDATLVYPNGFKVLHCNFVNGILMNYQFQFPDLLNHEKENWDYCRYPDRRFWSEVQNGLKPAKIAQKTQQDPPRKIPMNSYDTNDGFYDPKTKMLVDEDGELLRVPTCEEEKWIMEHCRKGFREFTRFRPDLCENWYNNDTELIQSLLNMQKKYKKGEISEAELYQFYADHDQLPSYSPYKKSKGPEEFYHLYDQEGCPSPKKLVHRLEKRFQGHRIHHEEVKKIQRVKESRRILEERFTDKKTPSEKMDWKIKFSESNKTPSTSANPSLEDRDSRSILKHHRDDQLVQHKEQKLDGYKQSKLIDSGDEEEETISDDIELEDIDLVKQTSSQLQKRQLLDDMKEIIMDQVSNVVLMNREKHRDRFIRALSVENLNFGPRNEKERCIGVLNELFGTIPGKDEFCDSYDDQICDLRNLAHDKFQMVKYWGKRIFTLEYNEETKWK